MAIKELKTRIQLKYDSYANWTNDTVENQGANLVLLAGELGICEVQSSNEQTKDANVVPTVLFKVGNGTDPFKALPWASAKAADVYGWAKASDVVLEGKTIKFVGTNKTVVLNYATPEEVKAITDSLASRVTAIEAALDLGEGAESVSSQLSALDGRLDAIEGEKGAIAVAKQAAIDAAAADATSKANTAKADAIAEATRLDGLMDARVDVLEAAKTAQDTKNSDLEKAISDEEAARKQAITDVTTAYEAADKAINDKIGAVEGTVAGAIEAAKTAAASDAAAKVKALENGKVATNITNIAQNAADIEQLEKDLAAEVEAREDAIGRLESVEAFFETAEGETLDTALDTLKEIQDYLNGEGEAAGGVVGKVAQAEKDIDKLEEEFAAGGRVSAAEAAIDAVESEVDTLQKLTSGYTGEGAIKTAVDAAQEQADKGVEDAGKAQEAADKAQEEVDALEGVVATLRNEYNVTKALATTNEAAIAALDGRMDTAENDIDAIQAIVSTGNDSNAKLRKAITDLQTLTGDDAKGNEALHNELTRVAGLVDNTTTGLAATKAIADEAKTDAEDAQSRVAAIEGDYLKAADEYIFNCGSSTKVVHKQQA